MWMVLMGVALLPLVAVVVAVLARKFRPVRFEKKEPERDLGTCIDDTGAWAPRPPIRVTHVSPAVLALHKKKLEEERERAILCLEEELKAQEERDG